MPSLGEYQTLPRNSDCSYTMYTDTVDVVTVKCCKQSWAPCSSRTGTHGNVVPVLFLYNGNVVPVVFSIDSKC